MMLSAGRSVAVRHSIALFTTIHSSTIGPLESPKSYRPLFPLPNQFPSQGHAYWHLPTRLSWQPESGWEVTQGRKNFRWLSSIAELSRMPCALKMLSTNACLSSNKNLTGTLTCIEDLRFQGFLVSLLLFEGYWQSDLATILTWLPYLHDS